MARYTATVASPLQLEDAFAFMADLRNFEKWDPGVSSSELIAGGEPGLGATYRVKANGATLEYKTKEYQAPSEVYVVAKTTFFESLDRITVEAIGDASHVTYDAELRLNGPLRLFDPLLSIAFDRIGSKAAAGLEEALNAKRVS